LSLNDRNSDRYIPIIRSSPPSRVGRTNNKILFGAEVTHYRGCFQNWKEQRWYRNSLFFQTNSITGMSCRCVS